MVSFFVCIPADKKEPRGILCRAAQTGGILESFLNYRNTLPISCK